MTKKEIEIEKQKVFNNPDYIKLSIERRITLLNIMKVWIDDEINF